MTTPVLYATLSNVPSTPQIDPGASPTFEGRFYTGIERQESRDRYKVEKNRAYTHINMDLALKDTLTEAYDDVYLGEFKIGTQDF